MDADEDLPPADDGPDAVVRYGEHPDQLLDVHLATTRAGRAPVVVLVHGGFWWQEYDRLPTRPLAQALAAQGWAVVTPEYRRTGGAGGWPATLDDVAGAVGHLPEVAAAVPDRLDLDDVTVVGHSAGGHLALWLARRPGGVGIPGARAVVALAPVGDLRSAYEQGLGDRAVEALMGGSPEQRPQAYAAADPAVLPAGDLPVTVIHGALDAHVPVQMSRALTGVRYVELPDVEHFGVIDPLSTAWPHLLTALRR